MLDTNAGLLQTIDFDEKDVFIKFPPSWCVGFPNDVIVGPRKWRQEYLYSSEEQSIKIMFM